MEVTYISNYPYFDQLWNLVSDDPCDNDLTDEMKDLLKDHPLDRSYLFISNDDSKVISVNHLGILKHTIGENPSCWSYAHTSGPIKETPGRGPLFVIPDLEILNRGILDLVGNIFGHSSEDDHTEAYWKIIYSLYDHKLQIGDIVHIPVYDAYSMDHDDIYFYLLIYDGSKLIHPKECDNYGSIPPKGITFPDFPLEHFAPLGRSGNLLGGFRWVTEDIVRQYNQAEILSETYLRDDNEPYYIIKVLNINGENYYFVGKENEYPVEIRQIHIDYPDDYIDDDELRDIEYVLFFN